jgi:hypothetical protein
MKKDKLLQHQLKRLNALLKKRGIDFGDFATTADKLWWNRFSNIYGWAIHRSLVRFRVSLGLDKK